MKWKMNHENNTQESNEQAEDDDLFYFESDHLALRGNIDYSEVLKSMFVLEAQRSRALQVSSHSGNNIYSKINIICIFKGL